MRFMIMHRTNAHWEAGAIPDASLIARVGELLRELAQGKRLLAGEGLRSSSLGARLRTRAGTTTITPGPFGGAVEPESALAIVQVAAVGDAVDWALRLAEGEPDLGIDVRPVTEPWDIGVGTEPPDPPARRFMLVEHAAEEDPAARAAGRRAARGRALGEMQRAGVLLASEALAPTARGRRHTFSGGSHRVFDGPFTESKELIGGYVLLRLDTIDEADAWAVRYANVVDVTDVDVREVEEPFEQTGA